MFLILLLAFLFSATKPILASSNIFGLHLSDLSDIKSASPIINSSSGDWGWATIVIRSDQLDKNIWQAFFNQARQKHIIPIVRIATTMSPNYWQKPTQQEIDKIIDFLTSLNWPTKKQHVILFNEINHANEWGGQVNIAEFSNLATYACQNFKTKNPNFYVLSSGLDLASPSQMPQFESASNVYQQIYKNNPDYFDCIDAIASHSYPNHGFIGRPTDTGQHSIRGYQWELNFIKSIGINKTYPVFITETGWPHREGQTVDNNFYSAKTSAQFLIQAYKIWQADPRVRAVTPFIYNYYSEPFDHFSWCDQSQQIMTAYQPLIDLPKTKNQPQQITKFVTEKIQLPIIILTDHQYLGKIKLKNTGQSIWGQDETKFCLTPQTTQNVEASAICVGSNTILPGQSIDLDFKFKIKSDTDHEGKTFLGWQDTQGFEITPFYSNATIYRPKTGIRQKIAVFLKKLIK